ILKPSRRRLDGIPSLTLGRLQAHLGPDANGDFRRIDPPADTFCQKPIQFQSARSKGPAELQQQSWMNANTPLKKLLHACQYNDPKLIPAILSQNPDLVNNFISTISCYPYTPLSTAAFNGHLDIVLLLVEEFGAVVNTPNSD